MAWQAALGAGVSKDEAMHTAERTGGASLHGWQTLVVRLDLLTPLVYASCPWTLPYESCVAAAQLEKGFCTS